MPVENTNHEMDPHPEYVELDVLSAAASAPVPPDLTPTTGPNVNKSLYTGLPLHNPQSIRVLDIPPVPGGDPTAPLRCTIRVIDLEQSPRFTAVSYVWGIWPELPPTILCNDEYNVPINPKGHEALLALRNHHSDNANGLTIWVDGICINQDDKDEKAVQIPLMGTIYNFAETVFVWLGEGTPGAQRTAAWLNHATRKLPGRPGNLWICGPKKMTTAAGDIWRESWRRLPFEVRRE